ncbi:MAG TPA: hypothetical protein VJZ00_18755 [Thermoanaerobaculia bacterium]|nr:hypothetical protein [Thermoanaerobaculia bacterium]
MITTFVVCFIAGLGLSVVSFVSGLHSVTVFDNIFHGIVHSHRALNLHAPRSKSSMINAAAITAFLTWFGGGGLLLERLTPLVPRLVVVGAVVIGLFGASIINSIINALARRESVAASLTMTGVVARTVVPIRAGDGTGEIVFTHAGTRRVCAARSDSGQAIDKGSEVIVTRYEKGIAYVATWSELTEV